jgi:hypothetical protein
MWPFGEVGNGRAMHSRRELSAVTPKRIHFVQIEVTGGGQISSNPYPYHLLGERKGWTPSRAL